MFLRAPEGDNISILESAAELPPYVILMLIVAFILFALGIAYTVGGGGSADIIDWIISIIQGAVRF